uniref:sulfatase family protein n=1 Tax=Alistipes sp. TaxID=1872444 RepID=UPI004055A7A5
MKLNKTILPLAGLALAACSVPQKPDHPNIIYIFPDQFRNSSLGIWQESPYAEAVGWQGDPVKTPNLNRFAREAVVLTEAVSTCPVSSPHRGMLLSGMYPERNGVTLNCMAERPESQLREDIPCMGDLFKAAGYDCGYIGKLHVDFPTPNNPQAPGTYVSDRRPEWDAYTPPERRHGFDFWYSYGTFDEHKNPHYWDTEGRRHDPKEWSVKHETDVAIRFIEEQQKRSPERPFMLMLAYNPPHSPYASLEDCMEEDYAHYAELSLSELYRRPNADTTMVKAPSIRYYFANVTGIDREVGRLLSTLEELGIDKNTIVVFASDHGETMCSHGLQDPKNTIYRESLNIPFIVRYPGHLTPRIDSTLLSSTDILPTLLGLSGLGERIPSTVQGEDLSAALRGEASAQRPEAALYMRNLNGERDQEGMVRGFFGEARGVKSARYTFEVDIDRQGKLKEMLLFDDWADPYQLSPISIEEHPELVAELSAQLGRLLREKEDVWYRERILSELIPYEE